MNPEDNTPQKLNQPPVGDLLVSAPNTSPVVTPPSSVAPSMSSDSVTAFVSDSQPIGAPAPPLNAYPGQSVLPVAAGPPKPSNAKKVIIVSALVVGVVSLIALAVVYFFL